MAYDARVLQILIASPGDVNDEREIISEIIYEWNYVYSRERSVVLLPLRWETHSTPEMGSPPQDVINLQVVDYCDMAIGVFWTRLGTPTNEADSGTAEEISRVGDAGKPVMLYFSQAKASLETLDLEEYGRLREFKKETYPNGLIESYSSLSDFREKLRRQLAIRIRDLIAESAPAQSGSTLDVRSIVLTFAYGNPPTIISPPNILRLANVICTDRDEIPDYIEPDVPPRGTDNTGIIFAVASNSDYYREVIEYYRRTSARAQLRLAVSSPLDRSVRDIYMEIRVRTHSGNVTINPPTLPVPSSSGTHVVMGGMTYFGQSFVQTEGQVLVEKVGESEWRMEVNIPVIQARRTIFSYNDFILEAIEDSTVSFDATVYSSDAPPFPLSAELDVRIEAYRQSYREILKQAHINYERG